MRVYASVPPPPTEAELELRAFERAEQVEEFHALCEHSLAELITVGTSLAKAVATRLEFDVARDLADRYGSAGFKGGMPAGKAFALASQSVRRSILLLRKLLQPGWWEAVEPEEVRRRAPVKPSGGAPGDLPETRGAGEDVERLDRIERVDRLETVERLGAEVAPGRAEAVIAGLKQDMAEAADRADRIWPGLPDAALAGVPYEPPGPCFENEDEPDWRPLPD